MSHLYLCKLSYKGKVHWLKIGRTDYSSVIYRTKNTLRIGPYKTKYILSKYYNDSFVVRAKETKLKIQLKKEIPETEGEWVKYSSHNIIKTKKIFSKITGIK